MTLTLAGLSAALILFTIRNRESSESLAASVNYVNIGMTIFFGLLTWLVRCSTLATWFICPSITAIAFYYFAFLEHSAGDVASIFSIVVAMSTIFFILILFNEVWLISTSVYAPLLAFYMHKMG